MAFNMDDAFEKIKEVGERNAGVVTTKQIEKVGICRGLIEKFVEKDNTKIKFHYAQKKVWNLGITYIDTSLGNKVMLYDKERCICDLVMKKMK